MNSNTFFETLAKLKKQTPFRSFRVELMNGEKFVVKHPETLVFNKETALYLDPDGDWSIFSFDGVTRFVTNLRKKPDSPNGSAASL